MAGASPGGVGPFRVLRGTVLLVDDDPDVLAGLGRSLRRSAFRLLTAATPREALDLLGREAVDVVVSDLRMPGMDGIELLDHARARRPRAVRIVLTGDPDLRSALAAINQEEVFRFLTKPVAPADLQAVLHLAFDRLDEEAGAGR